MLIYFKSAKRLVTEGQLCWENNPLTIVKLYSAKYCQLKTWKWQELEILLSTQVY